MTRPRARIARSQHPSTRDAHRARPSGRDAARRPRRSRSRSARASSSTEQTWRSSRSARIGVVGPNGGGKSTLLKILAGLEDRTAVRCRDAAAARVAYLDQHPAGDDRTPLQTVLDARPDLVELDRELTELATQLGSAEVIARPRSDDARAGPPGGDARAVRGGGRAGRHGEAARRSSRLGLSDGRADAADAAASRAASASSSRSRPASSSGPTCCCWTSPRRTSTTRAAPRRGAARARFDGRGRHGLARPLSARRDGRARSPSWTGRITLWPGNYSAYTARARGGAAAPAERLRRPSRRRSPGWRRPSRASSSGPASSSTSATSSRRATSSARSTAWRRSSGRCWSGARWRCSCAPTTRGGQHVFELREAGVAFGDDIVLLGVDLWSCAASASASSAANGAGKSVLLKMLAGELAPTEGERLGRAVDLDRLLRPGAGDARSRRRRRSRPCVAPKPVYEEQAVALLGRSSSPTSRCASRSTPLSGGERSRLQLLLLMLGGDRTAGARRADEPSRHRLGRGAGGRARRVRRHGGGRSRTTATSSTASPTASSRSTAASARSTAATPPGSSAGQPRRVERAMPKNRAPRLGPLHRARSAGGAMGTAVLPRRPERERRRGGASRGASSLGAPARGGWRSAPPARALRPRRHGARRRSRRPGLRSQLAAGLEALPPEIDGLRGATEALRLLGRDRRPRLAVLRHVTPRRASRRRGVDTASISC